MPLGDPADLSEDFNTELTPEEEASYQKWAETSGRARDVYDYDLRGAWKTGVAKKGGHLPDTFKKPNHPTFSEESRYSEPTGFMGGQWGRDEKTGKDYFTPGPANFHWRSVDDLQNYFKQYEKGVELKLDHNTPGPLTIRN